MKDFDIVMHVHDEVVLVPIEISVQDICALMDITPWAQDFALG